MISTRAYRALAASLFAAGLLAVGGCSSRTTAQGKVTAKGKPVLWGTVKLVAGDGVIYSGPINDDGTFTIEGVPIGPAKVGVSSPRPEAAPKGTGGGLKTGLDSPQRGPTGRPVSEAALKGWFPIDVKYSEVSSSGLVVDVVRGKDLVIDLP
ncbi:MAG: hypothetical protein U0797_18540 [Gemmataceae bacterium]